MRTLACALLIAAPVWAQKKPITLETLEQPPPADRVPQLSRGGIGNTSGRRMENRLRSGKTAD
jgi:hypothetical protein